MKTNNRGFTLVEAVVVAAIMAILAAVAIPMYSGFIRDQQQSTVDNLAETAAAAANAYVRRIGACPTKAQLNLYYDATKYEVSEPSCNLPNGPNTLTVTLTGKGITSTKNF